MTSSSEAEEILQLAANGIPRVAQVIAEIPTEGRKLAFDAAEKSYRQTVDELGYEHDDAERCVVVCTLFDRAGSLVALSTKAKKFSGGHELQA